MDSTKSPLEQARRCHHCSHYRITHDVHFPYACRILDFKSRRQPSLDVLEASGQPCLYFQAKNRQ
jgi:hypothetical protein